MKPLRILHISDLHERAAFTGMPSGRTARLNWDVRERAQVLGPKFVTTLATLASEGVDLVCFTGDLADWGHPSEFAEATRRLNSILETVGVPKKHFFIVPGNHDVQRTTHPDAWKGIREWVGKTHDGGQLGRWMASVEDAPPGIAAGWRDEVLSRTASFRNWLTEFGRSDLLPNGTMPLGYRHTLPAGTFGHVDVPIHMVGLDSAWLCGGDDDQGRILVTEEQVQAHILDREGALDGLRIGMIHHPLSHLADHHRVWGLLADDGVDVLLHGHQHTPLATVTAVPGARLRELAAGCLMEGDVGKGWPNCFQLLEVDVLRRSFTVHLRKWARDATPRFWAKGSDVYVGAPDGVLSWDADPSAGGASSTPMLKSSSQPQPTSSGQALRWRVELVGTVTSATAPEILALLEALRASAHDARLHISAVEDGSIIVHVATDAGDRLRSALLQSRDPEISGFRILSVERGQGPASRSTAWLAGILARELAMPSPHGGDRKGLTALPEIVHLLQQRGELDTALAEAAKDALESTEQHSLDQISLKIELAAAVRRSRMTEWLVRDFRHHLLWHLRPGDTGRLLSAIAACAPDFDYSYAIFVNAVEQFHKEEADHRYGDSRLQTPLLEKFVDALDWRGRSIRRAMESQYETRWTWPESWGDVGWDGPIVRDTDSDPTLDQERLSRALDRYRTALGLDSNLKPITTFEQLRAAIENSLGVPDAMALSQALHAIARSSEDTDPIGTITRFESFAPGVTESACRLTPYALASALAAYVDALRLAVKHQPFAHAENVAEIAVGIVRQSPPAHVQALAIRACLVAAVDLNRFSAMSTLAALLSGVKDSAVASDVASALEAEADRFRAVASRIDSYVLHPTLRAARERILSSR